MALLLASAGTYAVVSYEANRRIREMGIRSALGATRRNLIRYMVGRSIRNAGVGLAARLAGAAALTRFMESILVDITPLDPPAFVGAALLLTAAVVLAAYLPAQRASGANPVECLRSE